MQAVGILATFEAACWSDNGRSYVPSHLVCLANVWTTSIVSLAVIVGAVHGWKNHGLIGAIALGFCGLFIGGFLSSPSILLQILA